MIDWLRAEHRAVGVGDLAECRLQRRQRLRAGRGAHRVVAIERDTAIVVPHRNARALRGCLGLRGVAMRRDCDGVELGAPDILIDRQQVGGDRYREIARALRQLGFRIEIRLVAHERNARHALDAAGERVVDLPGLDGGRCLADRCQAGDAIVVDGDGGNVVRQFGAELRYQREVAALSADLPDATEHEAFSALAHVADAPIKCIDETGDEVLRLDRRKRAVCARLAARRADRIVDVDRHSRTQKRF